MLRFQGNIHEQHVNILVDSGSTHKLPVEQSPHMNVVIRNGEYMRYEGICTGVPIVIAGHTFTVDLHLLPIFGTDVVLGAYWLADLGPATFCFQDLWLSFARGDKTIRLEGLKCSTIPTQISSSKFIRLNFMIP
ncbi:unnamed protein product [Rhodiola kirilowii]